MRIPSGVIDQKIFFVALDTTLASRVTGLSTWTVYRSRNGGTATAYTTPTVAELSAANMAGVYCLTIDEDTTIASSSDSEEYAVHITATGMAPVTRTIELYRREVTANTTLATADVTAIKAKTDQMVFTTANRLNSQVYGLEANVITAAATATDFATEINTGIATSAALATVDTNVSTVLTRIGTPTNLGGGATLAFNLSDIEAQTDDIGAAGAGLTALASAASITTLSGFVDTEVAAILAAVDTEVAAIKAKTDNLPTDPADASDIAARFTTLDTAVADLPTNAELATSQAAADDATLAAISTLSAFVDTEVAAILAAVDTEVAAIKTKTDALTFTVAGVLDANVQAVNDTTVTGAGTGGSPWARNVSDAWGGSWGVSWGTSWGEEAAGVDALNANDIQSASSVTTPALHQEHDLLAADVASASSVTSPALGQNYGLAANDVVSASSVSAPLLGEIEAGTILAEDVVSASFVSTPTLVVEGEVIPIPPEVAGGGKAYGRGYPRKRWEELLRRLEAERREALQRANAFRGTKDRKQAKKAAYAASQAIAEAREAADEAAVVAHAGEITRMLEGAAQAKSLAEYLERMKAAREAAVEMELDDDDEAILMLVA